MHNHENNAQAPESQTLDRRSVLKTGAAAVVASAAVVGLGSDDVQAQNDPYAPPAKGALPPSNMKLDHR